MLVTLGSANKHTLKNMDVDAKYMLLRQRNANAYVRNMTKRRSRNVYFDTRNF